MCACSSVCVGLSVLTKDMAAWLGSLVYLLVFTYIE